MNCIVFQTACLSVPCAQTILSSFMCTCKKIIEWFCKFCAYLYSTLVSCIVKSSVSTLADRFYRDSKFIDSLKKSFQNLQAHQRKITYTHFDKQKLIETLDLKVFDLKLIDTRPIEQMFPFLDRNYFILSVRDFLKTVNDLKNDLHLLDLPLIELSLANFTPAYKRQAETRKQMTAYLRAPILVPTKADSSSELANSKAIITIANSDVITPAPSAAIPAGSQPDKAKSVENVSLVNSRPISKSPVHELLEQSAGSAPMGGPDGVSTPLLKASEEIAAPSAAIAASDSTDKVKPVASPLSKKTRWKWPTFIKGRFFFPKNPS